MSAVTLTANAGAVNPCGLKGRVLLIAVRQGQAMKCRSPWPAILHLGASLVNQIKQTAFALGHESQCAGDRFGRRSRIVLLTNGIFSTLMGMTLGRDRYSSNAWRDATDFSDEKH